MSAATANKVQNLDTATMVLATMRRRGISGLPRNYELVYEALNSSNAALVREFEALGRNPNQSELDALGKKHFPYHHRGGVVEGAHDKISGELEGMLRLLKQEQSSLESYSKLLGETYSRISSKSASSADILSSVISVLSNATGDTMEKGKVVVEHMVERAREMEQVKLELDEYKRIANTDPLTRLANRRAFDEILSNLYIGIVHVFITANATKQRLAELTSHAMPSVLASTAVLKNIAGNLGQAKGVIKLSIGEKPTVGGNLGTVEFQLQSAVKIDPQRGLFAFTRRVT